ncbi:hypothetical protein GCM10009727_61310 [Actinomadura napierensis]|uniref:Methionine synthase n=1 Tax=Actinomadura napierensis TaxID=267854 RepID=A0ABN3A6B3_9ACTN
MADGGMGTMLQDAGPTREIVNDVLLNGMKTVGELFGPGQMQLPFVLQSTAVMKENLEELLAGLYDGEVRYARDAFEGLRLMNAFMAVERGEEGASLPPLHERRVRRGATFKVTEPPFWGDRVVKGVALADYAAFLDERATFMGQWGLKPSRGGDGPSYEELVETEGRPRLRMWLDRVQTEGLIEAGVVYGYFPAVSEGDDLVVLNEDGAQRERFGPRIAEATGELFADDEALIEYWHARPAAGSRPDRGGAEDFDPRRCSGA